MNIPAFLFVTAASALVEVRTSRYTKANATSVIGEDFVSVFLTYLKYSGLQTIGTQEKFL